MSFECWIFSHFIWSHPTVTAVCVIPSHLNSSHVFWVFSPHLSSSQLMSSYLSLFDVVSFSSKSICSLVVFHGCSSHVKTSDLSSVFLTLAIPKPNKTPQQLFPCRRHKKFRVVASAVSDPQVHWDRKAFTQRSFYTQQAFTQRILYTPKLLHTANCYTQPAFTQRSFYTKLGAFLFTESFYTEQTFTQRIPYTEKQLHTEAFTHCHLLHRNFYTQQIFTQRSFYTEKPQHRGAFKQRNFYTEKTFTQRSLHTKNHLQRETFTHRQKFLHAASFYTEKP